MFYFLDLSSVTPSSGNLQAFKLKLEHKGQRAAIPKVSTWGLQLKHWKQSQHCMLQCLSL